MSEKIKILLILSLLFSLSTSFSQESQTETLIKGRITAPDLEGSAIHIINLTQRTGTVNSASGEFNINVHLGDILQFSSVQYKKLEVSITPGIIQKGFLNVELTEDLNQLAEVTVSDIDLTGNLGVDLENIVVVKDLLPAKMNFGAIKYMHFDEDVNDPQSAPENIAFKENTVMQSGGVNLLGAADAISGLLGIKKEPKPITVHRRPLTTIATSMRSIFDDDFFKSSLGIKEENINDFIFFIDEQGLTSQMLEEKNRLTLIEFLFDKSKNYKNIRAEN